MTDPVDLDRLDALHAAATPGEWIANEWMIDSGGSMQAVCVNGKTELMDCAVIVALHNAWPAISAELRRLRTERNGAMAGAFDHIPERTTPPPNITFKTQ